MLLCSKSLRIAWYCRHILAIVPSISKHPSNRFHKMPFHVFINLLVEEFISRELSDNCNRTSCDCIMNVPSISSLLDQQFSYIELISTDPFLKHTNHLSIFFWRRSSALCLHLAYITHRTCLSYFHNDHFTFLWAYRRHTFTLCNCSLTAATHNVFLLQRGVNP